MIGGHAAVRREGPDRWLAPLGRRPGASQRLICLPYAGAGAAVYRGWSERLGDDVDLCAVRLPGRETRVAVPAFTNMFTLVDALVDAVRHLLDRPYAIFGHSMGSLVGFELTRALRRQSLPLPAHLIVSGRRAPHLPDPYPPLHPLPDRALLTNLRERYGDAGPALDHAELAALLIPTIRADFQVCETYQPPEEPPLELPMTAMAGADDPVATPDELAAWQVHCAGAFRHRVFPGGHFFIRDSESQVVACVAEILAAAPSQ